MNKEELINLRSDLKEIYYPVLMIDGNPEESCETFSKYEIKKKLNIKQILEDISQTFENLIIYLHNNNISFDEVEIEIKPKMEVLIREEDYDNETGIIKENARFLKDYIMIVLNEANIKLNGENIEIPEEIQPYKTTQTHTTSFREFVIELSREGLSLEGINTYEDLKKHGIGTISINLSKEKEITLN